MKRSHRRSNYLQSLSLDMNGKTKPRNGSPHKEFLPLAIKRCKSTPAAMMTNTAEFIECSLKLFPHLIHIFELTKEFIHRASGVIDIPNEWADLDVTFVKAKVIALRCPEKDCRPIEKFMNDQNTWPFTPTISVCEEQNQVEIKNGILFMNGQKYEETKQMLEAKYLDNKAKRSAIAHPDVREVHEALTELLETPIWKLLIEIKQNMQKSDVSDKQVKLSMELDILLNTVKHPVSIGIIKSISSAGHTISEIPDELRNYLLRKRDVSGFGIWNNNEFRVFVNQEYSRRHLQENMLTNFAQFFGSYRLNVIVCNPRFRQYFKQGEKIFPNKSTPLKPNEENGYGTLGGFVTDQNADIHALTCAHVCQQGSSFFVPGGVSSTEKIGECAFKANLQAETIQKFIDVALVKIDKRVKDMCDLSMYNDESLPSPVRIYSKEDLLETVKKTFVYKIGASTSVTRGVVTSPEYHSKEGGGRGELFFISGVGDAPFAKEGDSGSIVFTVGNSSTRDIINIVGMVFGGFTQNSFVTDQGKAKKATDGESSTKRKKDDEELGRKYEDTNQECACFRMDTALKFLKENGWKIRFKDQI